MSELTSHNSYNARFLNAQVENWEVMSQEPGSHARQRYEPDEPITPELSRKAQRYEPMASWLLKDGKVLAYDPVEIELDRPFAELSAVSKFEVLTEAYNSLDNAYNLEDMIEYVAAIVDDPEDPHSSQVLSTTIGGAPDISLDSAGCPEGPDEYPEVRSNDRERHKTGRRPSEPEMQKVVRELETGEEDEWIESHFIERTDSNR